MTAASNRGLRLAPVFLIVGIVLSPLRATVATVSMAFAYDVAVRSTVTMQGETGPSLPPERCSACEYDYDGASSGYEGTTRLRVTAPARGVHAYDDARNFDDRRELAERVIYDASTAMTEAGGVADDAFVVRGGIATADRIAGGIGPHRDVPGLTGFSAQSRTGASPEELAATGGVGGGPFPNGQVSVTTAGQLRCIGCDVVPSPGGGANHVSVTPGPATPEQLSEVFVPRPNPARPR